MSNIETATIHEHAHMFWFNLPKHKQAFFSQEIREIHKSLDPTDEELWDASDNSFDYGQIKKLIQDSASSFFETLGRLNNHNTEAILKLINSINNEDQQKTIQHAIAEKHHLKATKAIAKVEISLSSSYGYGSVNPTLPGEEIWVEYVSGGFILEQFKSDRSRLEHQGVISQDDLKNWVEFRVDLLNENDKEYLKDVVKTAKNKPVSFFVSVKNKDAIIKAFLKEREYVAEFTNVKGGRYEADQLFYDHKNPYTTWQSIIGRRLKAGKLKGSNDLVEAYVDTMEKSLIPKQYLKKPNKINRNVLKQNSQLDIVDIGNPDGKKLRDIAYQRGLVPSSYSAANVDELWAVSVEQAAMGESTISEKLKQLIYSTLTGVPISSQQQKRINYSTLN